MLNDEILKIQDARKKAQAILDAPGMFEVICLHVASGGVLLEICEQWKISYAYVYRWINAEDERREAFQEALKCNIEWMRDRIRMEFKSIATMDLRKLYKDDGTMIPVHELPEEVARALGGIEIDAKGRKKYKVIDKIKALERYGDTFAMFVQKHEVEHKGELTLAQILAGSYKKPEGEDGNGNGN